MAAKLAQGQLPTWPDSSWTIKGSFPPIQYAAQAATFSLTRVGADPQWLYRFPIRLDAVQGYPMARFGSALLLTAVALWGPTSLWSSRLNRLWVGSYLVFLIVCAAWTEWLLFSNPCL